MKNNRFSISIRYALMLLVFLLGLPAFGYDETVYEDGLKYDIDTYEGYAVCYGNGASGSIVIPSSIYSKNYKKYYPVTSIGESAFSDCSSLTSIKIPNSVTSIGKRAFSYCSGLTSINIPESVTSIDDYAFEGCI